MQINNKLEFLSYGKQWIDEQDIQAVADTLRSDFLTQGPKIAEFEQAICDLTGAHHCVVVANGTAALHISVAVLGIEPDCEGITSTNTFLASANAMVYNGITPVFTDIDPKTYLPTPAEFEKQITEKTKILIPVHFAGQPCEMEKITQIAGNNDCFIIEDAAHAIGSVYDDGSAVGSCKYSDMAIFSFHPVKTITSGEGGAITTNDATLYEKLILLRNHGLTRNENKLTRNPGPWFYEMQDLGFNYRMTDLQAALGLAQLKKLDSFAIRRREIVNHYNDVFRNVDWLVTPYERKSLNSVFHLYVLKIDYTKLGKNRTDVMEILKAKNIGTQVHYIPVHSQPYYRDHYDYRWGDFPVAESYYEHALSIPLYPKMSDDQVEYVVQAILGLKDGR